ncbi:MAG: hypothetical protein HYY22_06170 [Thaumarchaeota archaeon]|nr:hypothetical protein [Nitrososphaerota archaeon]
MSVHPASAPMLVLEKSEVSVRQGESAMVDFDVLGEQKTLGVERPDKLPDGLDVSVVTGEKGRGVLNISAGSTTPEGEAII